MRENFLAELELKRSFTNWRWAIPVHTAKQIQIFLSISPPRSRKSGQNRYNHMEAQQHELILFTGFYIKLQLNWIMNSNLIDWIRYPHVPRILKWDRQPYILPKSLGTLNASNQLGNKTQDRTGTRKWIFSRISFCRRKKTKLEIVWNTG